MNPILYIKSHGIKGTLDIIYRYKIDQGLRKFAILLTKNQQLQNTIVIESHNDFDSNGGAFYDYLIKNHYNEKYKIVWLLKNKKPTDLPKNVTSFYLYKPSLRKQMIICRAKYILTCQDAIGSVRTGQTSIYLTHGTISIKKTGGTILLPANVNYCLIPSPNMESYLRKGITIEPNTRVVTLGYPEHDVLYSHDIGDLHKITTQKYSKVILWMPTLRNTSYGRKDFDKDEPLGLPLFSSKEEYEYLNKYLLKNNVLLVIKIHPMQDLTALKVRSLSNILILSGKDVKRLKVDNYRLMKDTDAFISDYSSAGSDYLHCDKPIAYVLNDMNNFKLGFIVDDIHELIAGSEIYNLNDLIKFIDIVSEGKDPYQRKRHALLDKVFLYHDGNSSKRLADFLNL